VTETNAHTFDHERYEYGVFIKQILGGLIYGRIRRELTKDKQFIKLYVRITAMYDTMVALIS